MATTPNSLIAPQTPKLAALEILPADVNAAKVLYSGGANGSKVVAVTIASFVSTTVTMRLGLTGRPSFFYYLSNFTIVSGAGINPIIAPVDAFSPLRMPGLPVDSDGQHYMFLESGDGLCVQVISTMNAGSFIHVLAWGMDF
jgi:hypothetical protein